MNLFVITGTSRGIGKALALAALANSNNQVIGISRTCTISHSQYTHQQLDLSDSQKVLEVTFPAIENIEKAVLINNSGELGEVKPFAKVTAASVAKTITINTIAPAILSNIFIKTYANVAKEVVIANISSGAGRHPIRSWSGYCASKAGLDMLSLVIAEEEKASPKSNVRIHSIAPGIVDTCMQDGIRTLSTADFPDHKRFVEYKEKGSLSDPHDVAIKIMSIVNNPNISETILDVRNL
ncbi:MAG: SDR family NAD(P)-dependent oxidoreductase [Bacteroidales bacterium]|nr:SDR family NAD(P)-dependent oxidoreductase [Bacteroidales bacterium]MBN2749686.1 SDR family NAD(P)-dependent oxidoreductase [Bacteroidales bacterium]